jgi:hypothetical protein
VRGSHVAGPYSSLAHAHQYAAPPDVTITPGTLTAERSLPPLAACGLYSIPDVDGEHPFLRASVNNGFERLDPPAYYDYESGYCAAFCSEMGNGKLLWKAYFAGMERGYCQIEKLANLDKIARPYGFKVSCLPIKIQEGSGGWCRAVALV